MCHDTWLPEESTQLLPWNQRSKTGTYNLQKKSPQYPREECSILVVMELVYQISRKEKDSQKWNKKKGLGRITRIIPVVQNLSFNRQNVS